MNNFLLSIANPLIRSHVRAWLTSTVTYAALYIVSCVVNQTPSVQHIIIAILNYLQGIIPSISGIVINGQIIPAKLAAILWLALSVTVLPALLRIPWIQKNQIASEIIKDAGEVAAQAPQMPIERTKPILPMPAAPAALGIQQSDPNVQHPLNQP